MARVLRGTVKKWNDDKGWGFITVQSEVKDFFAHYSEILGSEGGKGRRNLVEGQLVEFEPVSGDKGWQATKIREAV